MTKLYRRFAVIVDAMKNCAEMAKAHNPDHYNEMIANYGEELRQLLADHMPSGSGIDNGTKLMDGATSERIRFYTSFHHMDENGYYDGWTDHIITLKPSLVSEFRLDISGRNRNDIKDYLADVFRNALETEV